MSEPSLLCRLKEVKPADWLFLLQHHTPVASSLVLGKGARAFCSVDSTGRFAPFPLDGRERRRVFPH